MKKRIEWKWGPLSKKQLKVFKWWVPGSRYEDYDGIIADGSIRSGKTVSMGESFVLWAMDKYDRESFAMCGKTIQALRRNVIVNLKRQLRAEGYACTERKTENLMVVSKGNRANTFYFFGGKDESSQDLIQGVTLAGVFFDEVALMPESFVNQATGRCSVDGSKFWFNCNPEGPSHWFYRNWVLKAKKKKILYLHFTMDDNLSLTQKIRARYENMYSGLFYKRYILGLWCLAEGIIYDMFRNDAHVYRGSVEGKKHYYVSCDYGTQNATVFLLWEEGLDGVWRVIREYYYSGRAESKQKTDSEYADELAKWLDGIEPLKIIVDPAAASFIAELRKRGYTVKKAKNDVVDGIRFVSSLLKNKLIQVNATCKHTIIEFGGYMWDEKAADRGEDKPVKKDDHCMDALRYFCYTIIRSNGGMQVLK